MLLLEAQKYLEVNLLESPRSGKLGCGVRRGRLGKVLVTATRWVATLLEHGFAYYNAQYRDEEDANARTRKREEI